MAGEKLPVNTGNTGNSTGKVPVAGKSCKSWTGKKTGRCNWAQATLCQIIMNIPNPIQPSCKLFHAVNIMYTRDTYIFWFHPSCSQQARKVVAGLLVFLTGLWDGMINMTRFHKFFTNGAIERTCNAWWGTNTLCIATRADQEMANILPYDTDLIFPETKVELEMSGTSTWHQLLPRFKMTCYPWVWFPLFAPQQHHQPHTPEQCSEAPCAQKQQNQNQTQPLTPTQLQAWSPYQRVIFKSS